ncbi:hypothetical protein HMPREF0518_0909 [Lactobacillus helveticus DSM 20075 = CGMCC 1.1877]|nr:hypothetical protein HMPREF0518_0909 [Lactobacillus helveticus DSM 20075 = CGMCC 1.1877]
MTKNANFVTYIEHFWGISVSYIEHLTFSNQKLKQNYFTCNVN